MCGGGEVFVHMCVFYSCIVNMEMFKKSKEFYTNIVFVVITTVILKLKR